ncbi:MAG: DUF6526 family protein [bacterium]
MEQQTYANHRRIVPMYHYVLTLLIFATLIGSVVNLVQCLKNGTGLYSASLIVVMNVSFAILFYYARIFALKAQDRAIRAEENLRHYALTGKLLDPRLDIRQIIGLRFASDGEFLELEKRAVAENMKETEIKKAVKHWRGDTYRV